MKKIKKLKFDDSEKKKKHQIGIANVQAIQKYFNSRQSTFTKSMKNISTAIIRHPDILKNNLLVNFSKTLDLGEASVMRFCKHLGFRGFTEFKRYFIDEFFDIPDEQDSKSQVYDLEINESTTPTEILTKISNLVARITLETKQSLAANHQELTASAEKIFYAPCLFIFGTSSSKNLIEETATRFTNIGVKVIYATELQDMVSKACLLQKGDVAIAISCSGYSNDILKIINLLQKNRVHTISITSDPRSELSMICDSSFTSFGYYDKDFNTFQDSIYVRISQMLIFDTLIAMIISFDLVKAREHRLNAFNTMEQILSSRDDSPTVI